MTSLTTGWSSYLCFMSVYNKPYLTIADQVALLKSRGLIITDSPKAEHYLSKIGYYRLSGYSYVFRKSVLEIGSTTPCVLDEFKDSVRFDDILALYVFDKKLRLILLDAIERIEVALRVDVSLYLGEHNSKAHLDPSYLYSHFSEIRSGQRTSRFEDWVQKFQKSFKDSREDFVLHFKEKYPNCDLPIWMAVELWDFGTLSKYMDNLKDAYKAPIARQYGLETNKLIGSWLHTINVVRNICAHHGRLWNRVIATKPMYPKSHEAFLLRQMVENGVPPNRIFSAICIIQYLMRQISPNSHWHTRLVDCINNFPVSPYTNIAMMGFKDDWQLWQLWE